ncbi:bacteriocin [Streptococcus suis]|uniref:Bacteriocin n=1 Tax=Streptococcus suis TaxID=1307 RepID=A0A426T286_STRSU|nr:bacteriocin [Streptococcus suis]NQM49631.1 bacteriocin [Streptococcus suis]NQN11957.1 bacteriocin [Streptococcus suis]RRR43689.1 bacteriocin [Streptococcus suis]HEL2183666.1 bacteriocin [Streptococcus suis]HEM2781051.1 bacteriocin [Streptococcus suis]
MMKNTIKFKEVDADTLKNINGGGVGDFIQGMIFEIIYSAKQKRR